jgi:hypothetical protein
VTLVARTRGWTLAAWGGVLGLVLGGGLAVVLVIAQADDPDTGILWGVVAGAAYLAPFVTALLSLRSDDAEVSRAAWSGSGLAGIVLSMSSPAGVTVVLLVPSAVLIAAGIAGAAPVSLRRPAVQALLAGSTLAGLLTLAAMLAGTLMASALLLMSALVIWAVDSLILVRTRPRGFSEARG